eukprot:CAMPEP_0194405686 /NCGR_PEP_ID=MMETSP0176-20130528/4018_1 /TAXON_ID=216777 /ORGANISM="Proboscia alata, Strain PI-D3" /LENGTH=1326 /DNA_ID=CAMNT_0039204573 /DNA_START=58 /DNA_END=4038 /DNA_ORIENTATION=+
MDNSSSSGKSSRYAAMASSSSSTRISHGRLSYSSKSSPADEDDDDNSFTMSDDSNGNGANNSNSNINTNFSKPVRGGGILRKGGMSNINDTDDYQKKLRQETLKLDVQDLLRNPELHDLYQEEMMSPNMDNLNRVLEAYNKQHSRLNANANNDADGKKIENQKIENAPSSSSSTTMLTEKILHEVLKAAEDDVECYKEKMNEFRITESNMQILKQHQKDINVSDGDKIATTNGALVATKSDSRKLLSTSSSLPPSRKFTNQDMINLKRQSHQRRVEHEQIVSNLRSDAESIVRLLDEPPSRANMTQGEVTRERLERWQRALELYVLVPPQNLSQEEKNIKEGSSSKTTIDLLSLLDKLCEGCVKEEELSDALTRASQMCAHLCEVTAGAVRDAAEEAVDAEDAYHIRLEAQGCFAEWASEETERIDTQFRHNGRMAMKIGQQLEMAEAKRRQCEAASVVIRRWWMMENLAEQERNSGEAVSVNEEITGEIPPSSCRMDPLFTNPANSLEAAHALQMLRGVIKSRGNSAGSTGMIDPASSRRFELTTTLIQRTSDALESRLLNSFLETYAQGGHYDFSTPTRRPGKLDWQTLRSVAEALMYFDSGRKLHKRYVQQVVATRFPEFFNNTMFLTGTPKGDPDSDEDEFGEEFDMDETRSRLSTLFHRVSEVCRAEFELIAHVFASPSTYKDANNSSSTASSTSPSNTPIPLADVTSTVPLQVARLLIQRIISDPRSGLQARINDLLESLDKGGDFYMGSKKLDTFVVIHEKAAGLFMILKEGAEQNLIPRTAAGSGSGGNNTTAAAVSPATKRAVASLVQFLNSQEMALSNSQRRGYLNLELRLLHHECCAGFDRIGASMVLKKGDSRRYSIRSLRKSNKGVNDAASDAITDYRAPVMPLEKDNLKRMGFGCLLDGPLKPMVLRQPLIHATDSLMRARLMFGTTSGNTSQNSSGGNASSSGGGEGHHRNSTAGVILAIYSQMCTFYGEAYLIPIIESLAEMLDSSAPSTPPSLPYGEDAPPHEMGVNGNFWIAVERMHSAAKSFDRELWAEQRPGSARVWEILVGTGSTNSITMAKECRLRFFRDVEERGEAAILRALDTITAHIQWILVSGGESAGMTGIGTSRLLNNLKNHESGHGGPYSVPTGSALEASNSPAVQSLAYCLRAQFVHVQSALTPQSLSAFWTALSIRLYDKLITRLLQHYYVSNIGGVILSRDVEALRTVSMLAGTDHQHWDTLRELLTLYMTPPDALKSILVGPDGVDATSGKGLFGRAGQLQSLVFMSRRADYRVKSSNGWQKSGWAMKLLGGLGLPDPSERSINMAMFSAERH